MEQNFVLVGKDDQAIASKNHGKWYLATNQRNLFFMLAANLIMPPKGFGEKYYEDTLSLTPGWIPLFFGEVPDLAIKRSTSEAKHLIPCLAAIDLSQLSGKVKSIYASGEVNDILFPDDLIGNEKLILVPAPLPISWITSIIFMSKVEKNNCEADALNFSNIPLLDFKREVVSKLFLQSDNWIWPAINESVRDIDVDLELPFAAGAIMAMLFQFSNNGELSMSASRLAFDAHSSVGDVFTESMISALGEWMILGEISESADKGAQVFWGAVNKVAARGINQEKSSLDLIIEYLDISSELVPALSKLATELKSVVGFTDSTISEIFERHPRSFSRVMMLFFLRDNCEELLEFRHGSLNELDYIAAAILFAARDGWLKLPADLHGFHDLRFAVSCRMAAMAHRISKTGITLGVMPSRPIPLRELFNPEVKGWSKLQKDAALCLTKACKWDGVQTKISLGKGGYRLVVDGTGVHIFIDGEAKAVTTEVDEKVFFQNLATHKFSKKQYHKVCEQLKVIKPSCE